jgi:hypothetical protein
MTNAIELLQLLIKADRAGVAYSISSNDFDYVIQFTYGWERTKPVYRTVVFDSEGEVRNQMGDYTIDEMNEVLDEKLKEQERERINSVKRKELIASLTPEQRALLGL